MFAVVKIGGKQYRVSANEQITVMSLAGEPGDKITFDEVLFTGKDGAHDFKPTVKVLGEIISHGRGPKVISFKKRRRQNSKRKRGHRQDLTLIRITDIA